MTTSMMQIVIAFVLGLIAFRTFEKAWTEFTHYLKHYPVQVGAIATIGLLVVAAAAFVVQNF